MGSAQSPARPSPEGDNGGRALPIRIRLLGGFGVTVGDAPVPVVAWRLQKAQSLVKLLALVPGHRLARDQVLDLLWPDFAPEAATNNLYRTLAAARRALAPAVPLRLQGGVLVLDPDGPLGVDVEHFEEAAARARRSANLTDHEAALAFYGGELLPEDRYEDWAAARREGLKGTYHTLLLATATLHEAQGDRDAAITPLQRLVADDPTNESAHAALMRLFAASGQRARAARQYQDLQDTLARELDAEPGPEIRRLHAAILTGRFPHPANQADVEVAPPAAHTAVHTKEADASPQHNLPAHLTSFVGRERDLAELRDLLLPAPERPRLVTLTGIGGGGKTRLALAIAESLLAEYPHGVWLVELAPLADPALVARVAADALGVREQSGQPLLGTLVAALRQRCLLLVLDNCEHLVDSAADLVQSLLSACPALRILATSREVLRVPGEVAWRVPPLDLPATSATPGDQSSPEIVARSEAVSLFVERARARQSGFALTQANAGAVAAIVRGLDGVPLAIELAAARTGVLPPEQLSQRLSDSLRLLTTGTRTVPTRQQTLRAALDWSYRLLNAGEQRLLCRLSVFAGGWTLAAAEATAPSNSNGDDSSAGEALDLLEQLVDKSLVQVEPVETEARYRLLEPVRQYASELLTASDEEAAARERHAAFFLALAEELAPALWSGEQAATLARLDPEHDNLRAALRRAIDRDEAEAGLRLCGALWRFWWARGHLREGWRWLDAALALPHDSSPDLRRARTLALRGAVTLAQAQGDAVRSRDASEELVALQQSHGDAPDLSRALVNLGWAQANLDEEARARETLDRALALARESGDIPTIGSALLHVGYAAWLRDEAAEGIAPLEECLALARRGGNTWAIAVVLYNLGAAANGVGDIERARTLLGEALRLSVAGQDRLNILFCIEFLAWTAALQQQPTTAARLYGAIDALRDALGMPTTPGETTMYKRQRQIARGQLDQAAFDAAWQGGRPLTLEEATAEALAVAGS